MKRLILLCASCFAVNAFGDSWETSLQAAQHEYVESARLFAEASIGLDQSDFVKVTTWSAFLNRCIKLAAGKEADLKIMEAYLAHIVLQVTDRVSSIDDCPQLTPIKEQNHKSLLWDYFVAFTTSTAARLKWVNVALLNKHLFTEISLRLDKELSEIDNDYGPIIARMRGSCPSNQLREAEQLLIEANNELENAKIRVNDDAILEVNDWLDLYDECSLIFKLQRRSKDLAEYHNMFLAAATQDSSDIATCPRLQEIADKEHGGRKWDYFVTWLKVGVAQEAWNRAITFLEGAGYLEACRDAISESAQAIASGESQNSLVWSIDH